MNRALMLALTLAGCAFVGGCSGSSDTSSSDPAVKNTAAPEVKQVPEGIKPPEQRDNNEKDGG